MKFSTLLFAGSVTANLVLLGLILVGATSEAPPASVPALVSSEKMSSQASKDAAPGQETWASLTADDVPAQIERLKSEGFPPALIRAIMSARIRESFAARRKALEAAQASVPYWKVARPDPAAATELAGLWRAERKALTEALGPDPENGTAASLHRQFPNLPADKVDAIAAIRDRYDDMRNDIYAKITNAMLPEEQEKINGLDKAMHDELARTLSPEELENYDLRTGRTANQMRNNLVAFDASEQEFRAIYKLQSAFDAQFGPMYSAPSDEQMKARSAANKALQDDIKAALGDERFADYQRTTNYQFRLTSQLIERLELPPEAANQVYAVQQDIQKRASALRQDRSLSPADRTAQLAALATEAQTRVTTTLGAPGFEAYKQYGGSWLQALTPRPPPKN